MCSSARFSSFFGLGFNLPRPLVASLLTSVGFAVSSWTIAATLLTSTTCMSSICNGPIAQKDEPPSGTTSLEAMGEPVAYTDICTQTDMSLVFRDPSGTQLVPLCKFSYSPSQQSNLNAKPQTRILFSKSSGGDTAQERTSHFPATVSSTRLCRP